jgi:hypothetical protein
MDWLGAVFAVAGLFLIATPPPAVTESAVPAPQRRK